MTKIFAKLVEYFIQNDIIHDRDKEIYLYGLQQGFLILINIITTFLIGFAFGMIWQVAVFSVIYLPLRSYAGGYHARTQYLCYLFSIMLTSVVLLAIKFIPWTSISSMLVLIVASIIILILAPIEDINKPLDKIEIAVYKKRTRIILFSEIGLSLLMLILGASQILFCITTSLLSLSFMLLLGIATPKKKSLL